MRIPALLAITLSALHTVGLAEEMWELPPILYSKTQASDPVAGLIFAIDRGASRLPEGSENEVLRFLLDLLKIPESSQILVYSKTSAQNYFISPQTPRALYFNENAYVGHVLGGGFELAIHDPQVGVAFYFVEKHAGKFQIERNSTSCLNCHATRRTESVPGLTIRSVPTDENGNLLLTLGSARTDYRTPIPKRWAGYCVTGHSSLPHLGNRTYDLKTGLPDDEVPPSLPDLKSKIDTTQYLRATSDIVALMVLEHQCLVHNLLTRASMDYRSARWRESTFNKDGNTRQSQETAATRAHDIADAMLFKGEAALGDDGVDGTGEFQQSFTARFPKSQEGDSLADFHLGNRIFKNRCSYMIHSQAFADLPLPVKTAVFRELKERLTGNQPSDWIPETERKRIAGILTETVPGFAEIQ